MVTMTSEVDKAQNTLIMTSITTISNTPTTINTTCDVSHLDERNPTIPTEDSPIESKITTTSVNIEVHYDDDDEGLQEETTSPTTNIIVSAAKTSDEGSNGDETAIITEDNREKSRTPTNNTSSNTLVYSKDNLMNSTTITTESMVELPPTTDDHSISSQTQIPLAKSPQATTKPLTNINQTPNKQYNKNEDTPNVLVYKKMESIIERMQAEGSGVPVRTVKGFMTKVPSVFTGADLIIWILKNSDILDVTEALHFAHLLASHGYIFPIDDHILTVKNDNTFYRFQTPYFWPSNFWEPENTDYAVYLCKRTMQNKTRLELADYEAENLAKLQKMFSRKWEFIFMQAESQSKVAKKRDKLERKVLDSQERAFWDVHRPMPGCVNTTEIDIKKAYRRGASSHGTGSAGAAIMKHPTELLTRIICLRKQKLEHRTIKMSKAAEGLVSYYEQYNEFDYFLTPPEIPNPWQTDNTEMWDGERNSKEVPLRNVKRWGFSMRELLIDPVGREQFAKFLEKEYSAENILFWEAVKEMKALPQSGIKVAIQNIWKEFLAPDSPRAVNVDSKSIDLAREAVNSSHPNRWCFDVAAAHIYHLMETDSYARYLRSDMYKDYLNCSRKKIKSIPNLFGVKR